MFDYNALQLRNKVITVNTVCYSIFLYPFYRIKLIVPKQESFFQLFIFTTDLKRMFTNKMVSSICWCVIQGLVVLSLPDLVMYFYRPFPEWICFFLLVFKHAIVLRLLLLVDAAVIARFILIFWIKNPMNFQDDFWCHFVNIWAVIFRFSFICLSFSGSLSSHFDDLP